MTLAEAIGVGASGDDATIPRARDEFPAVPAVGAPGAAALLPGAVQQRRDLAAAAEREASAGSSRRRPPPTPGCAST